MNNKGLMSFEISCVLTPTTAHNTTREHKCMIGTLQKVITPANASHWLSLLVWSGWSCLIEDTSGSQYVPVCLKDIELLETKLAQS